MDTVNRGTRSSMWRQLSFFAALLANMSTTTKKSDEKAVNGWAYWRKLWVESPDLVQKQEFLVGEWTETFTDQLSSLLTFLEGQSKSINKQ